KVEKDAIFDLLARLCIAHCARRAFVVAPTSPRVSADNYSSISASADKAMREMGQGSRIASRSSGVVALTRAYAQVGPSGRAHADAPEAARRLAGRVVTEQVLGLKLSGDLAKDRWQVFDLCEVEGLAAGLCRQRLHRALTFNADRVQANTAAAR